MIAYGGTFILHKMPLLEGGIRYKERGKWGVSSVYVIDDEIFLYVFEMHRTAL